MVARRARRPSATAAAAADGAASLAAAAGLSPAARGPPSLVRHPLRALRLCCRASVEEGFAAGAAVAAAAAPALGGAVLLSSAVLAAWFLLAGAGLASAPDLVPSAATAAALQSTAAFASYWLVLGVASSVGFGSGLHTFVLFLGPHVARVAAAAGRTRSVAFSAAIARYAAWPAAWETAALARALTPEYAADAWAAPPAPPGAPGPSVAAVLLKVAPAAVLWGVGTAVGELPPYFLARAAAATYAVARRRRRGGAGGASAGVSRERGAGAAVDGDGDGDGDDGAAGRAAAAGAAAGAPRGGGRGRRRAAAPAPATAAPAPPASGALAADAHAADGWRARAHARVEAVVRRYGFWAILASASVPNPLFDVAGATAGSYGVSFASFFTATLIGKALVKVTLQVGAIVAAVLRGPALLAALRGRAPAWVYDAAAAFLERAQAGAHAACVGAAGGCAACCEEHFKHPGMGAAACRVGCSLVERLGRDAAGGGGAGAGAGGASGGEGGSGGAASALLGAAVLVMLLVCVPTTVQAVAEWQWERESAREAAGAAGGSAAGEGAAGEPAAAEGVVGGAPAARKEEPVSVAGASAPASRRRGSSAGSSPGRRARA